LFFGVYENVAKHILRWKRNSYILYTGLLTKDKTVKTAQNTQNVTIVTILRLIYVICLSYSYLMAYLMQIDKEKKSLEVNRNREYKEIDSINSLQSSLKSQLLWVTLYNYFRPMSFVFSLSTSLLLNLKEKVHETILYLQKLGLKKFRQPLRTPMR